MDDIIKNYQEVKVKAQLFALHEENELWLEGWINLDDSFEKFLSFVESEMKFTWEISDINIDIYQVFQIDKNDKEKLKEIKTEEQYKQLKESDDTYIVVLSKNYEYRIIENIPPVFEWFQRVVKKQYEKERC